MAEEPHIFISHVEEDAPLALSLAEKIERKGYSTWYYERDSLPGISYLEETGKAIARSKAFLLIISKDSLGSHQIDLELERAHEESKIIIPIRHGVSHPEFQNRRPLWRQIIGTRTSIEVDIDNVELAASRIVDALKRLEIPAGDSSAAKGRASEAALPRFCRYCGRTFLEGESKCERCGKPRTPIASGFHVVKEHLGLVEYDEGYVVDPTLKVLWQRDEDEVARDYSEAMAHCRDLRLGGFSDWRLPTKEELMHLARFGHAELQKVFPTIQKGHYWALTLPGAAPPARDPQGEIAYTVDLDPRSSTFGSTVTYFKRSKYCSKAVRNYC